MIIDAHCHFFEKDIPSKAWWDDQYRISALMAGKPVEAVRERMEANFDRTGDLLVKDMDEAGIDKSGIMAVDNAFWAGTGPAESLEETYTVYAKAVKRHPDRLFLIGSIDPRRPRAAQFVEKALKEWNVKGLKLLPQISSVYPNDKYCYLIYAKLEELGLPVVVHTGAEVVPFYSKYGQPLYLDEVANDFPNLNIVMAHAGGVWWEEAISICSMKTNLYLELAWWQPRVLRRPVDEFYKPLRQMLDAVGPSKVLFGSDWPALRLVRRLPHAAWVKVFTQIPPEVKAAGIEFSKAEISGIMGDNAARIFRLQPKT